MLHRRSPGQISGLLTEIPRKLDIKREVFTFEDSLFEGKVVKTGKFIVDDPHVSLKGLKASDFALENQIALGTNLSPAFCSVSSMPLVDSLAVEIGKVTYFEKNNPKQS